jgi:hypothetical protein
MRHLNAPRRTRSRFLFQGPLISIAIAVINDAGMAS